MSFRRQGARLLLLVSFFAMAMGMAAADRIVFKHLEVAIFKMDGKQVKSWEIYQAEKHGHLVLVQMGRRFLLLDTKAKEILEIEPAALEQKSKRMDVVWSSSPEKEKLIESDDWAMRSVGPMVSIKVLLIQEGRQMELQLPRKANTGWFY